MLAGKLGYFAPSGFNPKSLSGLEMWLDASVTTSLYDATSGGSTPSSGSGVARWEDQSGNGYHVTQGTANNRPARTVSARNSLDCLAWDGTNDGLVSGSVSASLAAYTVAIVTRLDGTGGGTFGRVWTRANDSGPRTWLMNGNTTWAVAGGARFTPSGTANTGTWYVLVHRWDGTADYSGLTCWVNGTKYTFASGSFTPNSTANTVYGIGTHTTLTTRSYYGLMGEVLIYNTSLSDANVSSVQSYLNNKWGF